MKILQHSLSTKTLKHPHHEDFATLAIPMYLYCMIGLTLLSVKILKHSLSVILKQWLSVKILQHSLCEDFEILRLSEDLATLTVCDFETVDCLWRFCNTHFLWRFLKCKQTHTHSPTHTLSHMHTHKMCMLQVNVSPPGNLCAEASEVGDRQQLQVQASSPGSQSKWPWLVILCGECNT